MSPVRKFMERAVPLPIPNVDTDQITPARFLKTTTKENLAEALFHDWRLGPDGSPRPDFPLNKPQYRGARILVAGDNFGCGSSREIAPWALLAAGFKAVISTSIADIFRNNSLKNGLVPIVIDQDAHAELLRLVETTPEALVAVDVEHQTVSWGSGRWARFAIDGFAKRCLVQGIDQMGYLLSKGGEIARYEAEHPAGVVTGASRGPDRVQ